MNAIVLGGCGFVGRHICRRLVDQGYSVTIVDNLMSESALAPADWPAHLRCESNFINLDCEEYFTRIKPCHEKPIDLVVHLAAVVGGRNVIENDSLHVAKDLAIDAHFFSWLTKLHEPPGLIVYFSSSAAYPVHLQQFDNHKRLREDDLDFTTSAIGIPDLSYGWAKLTGEFLAGLARESYGLNIAVYRPFSGFGEDQSDCYPFNSILNKVRKGGEVEIWSDSVRDFVHIEEIVDCVLQTMHKVAKEKTVLNIASGVATSFSDLARQMAKAIHGSEDAITIKVASDRPKGVYYRVGDTSKATEFGWTSRLAPLASMLSLDGCAISSNKQH